MTSSPQIMVDFPCKAFYFKRNENVDKDAKEEELYPWPLYAILCAVAQVLFFYFYSRVVSHFVYLLFPHNYYMNLDPPIQSSAF